MDANQLSTYWRLALVVGGGVLIQLAVITQFRFFGVVTVGEPKDFWRITLRPLGPSVTLTARASFCTPRRIASRAS